jgi:hypothetical protein
VEHLLNHVDSEAELLLEAINASWTTQTIATAVELHIPDLLADAPLDCDALARATGCHARSLKRLLAALASLALVTHDGSGRFALSPRGAPLRSSVCGATGRTLPTACAAAAVQPGAAAAATTLPTSTPTLQLPPSFTAQ